MKTQWSFLMPISACSAADRLGGERRGADTIDSVRARCRGAVQRPQQTARSDGIRALRAGSVTVPPSPGAQSHRGVRWHAVLPGHPQRSPARRLLRGNRRHRRQPHREPLHRAHGFARQERRERLRGNRLARLLDDRHAARPAGQGRAVDRCYALTARSLRVGLFRTTTTRAACGRSATSWRLASMPHRSFRIVEDPAPISHSSIRATRPCSCAIPERHRS